MEKCYEINTPPHTFAYHFMVLDPTPKLQKVFKNRIRWSTFLSIISGFKPAIIFQKCTPSCMIFIEFAVFIKNRYFEETLWMDNSELWKDDSEVWRK